MLKQGLQARTQRFALGKVHTVLQGLKHSLHGPLLPLVERDPVDVHLPADIRGLAPFRPYRQHRLDLVLGRVSRLAGAFLAFLLFAVGRDFG